MGLFSDKKKTIVNTTVQRVFEDANIPDSVRTGILKGILAEGSLTDYMLEELAGSIGVRAARGYLWAKNNNYVYGVPEGQFANTVSARGIVLSTIAAEVGQTITQDYCKYGPMNTIHYGWVWLIANKGYNPNTNELTAISAQMGFPVYLTDMVATYPQEDFDFIQQTSDFEMLAQWGPAPNSGFTPTNPFNTVGGIGIYAAQSKYLVSPTATDDFITVTYEYKNATGVIVRENFDVDVDVDLALDYHQVRYLKADGAYGFWTYREGAGEYPDIDGAYDMTFKDLGTYLPWCYFRWGGQRVKDISPIDYKDSKKWAKLLGVDYDLLDDGVHSDPDVDDVEQCILVFGVHPGAESQSEKRYLFEYFNVMYFNSLPQTAIGDTLAEKFGAFNSSPSHVQIIQDKIFQMGFQYSGITKTRVPGKIGKKGDLTTDFVEEIVGGSVIGEKQTAYVYRMQVLDSMYEEIKVYGLRTTYKITYKKGHSASGNEPELLVPVDRTLLNVLSMRAKEDLLTRALQMIVNTRIVVKTPWYASTFFKVILIVIAIVVTILSLGQAWATIVAAAAIGTTAVVVTVLTMILVSIAISYATKLFVKEFGPKVGFIAAVAAMIIGSYAGSNIEGSSWWADSMVAVGNNLATQSENTQTALLENIQDDMLDFQNFAKGEFDSLKEKQDQLGLNPEFSGLNGLDIVNLSPMQVWNEKPNDFYNRTVHSGNIGAASFDIAAGYVDFMLTLPTINSIDEVPTNGVPE